MSTTLHYYAGPALLCSPKGQHVQRQKEGVCLECHPMHRSIVKQEKTKAKTKFCGECGKPLQDVTVVERGQVDKSFVTEEVKEALSFICGCEDCPENVLTPNEERKAPREFALDGWSGSVQEELHPETITKELAWFQQAFSKEIARIKEIYGPEHVKVAWILRSYWY